MSLLVSRALTNLKLSRVFLKNSPSRTFSYVNKARSTGCSVTRVDCLLRHSGLGHVGCFRLERATYTGFSWANCSKVYSTLRMGRKVSFVRRANPRKKILLQISLTSKQTLHKDGLPWDDQRPLHYSPSSVLVCYSSRVGLDPFLFSLATYNSTTNTYTGVSRGANKSMCWRSISQKKKLLSSTKVASEKKLLLQRVFKSYLSGPARARCWRPTWIYFA
jgi:hypothetical protein